MSSVAISEDAGNLKESKSRAFPGVAAMATAMAVVAVGAFAIGRLSIRRLLIRNATLRTVEIQDLSVRRIRVDEMVVSGSLKLPENDAEHANS